VFSDTAVQSSQTVQAGGSVLKFVLMPAGSLAEADTIARTSQRCEDDCADSSRKSAE
jgi:hypothetical protein